MDNEEVETNDTVEVSDEELDAVAGGYDKTDPKGKKKKKK